MNFAGFPAHISFAGMDLVTTEPAPTMEFSPIETPFNIIVLAPINALSPIVTGAHFLFFKSSAEHLIEASRE